jgi:hypothetical protein
MVTFVVMLAVCLAVPFGGGAVQKAVQPHEGQAQAVVEQQAAPAATLVDATALPAASAEAGDGATPVR